MTGERSEHEHQAEIDRLNRVQNEKYTMQHNLHTAQLLNQDLCHREETNQMKAEIYRLKTETNELKTETYQLKAEIVIQTNCHKAGMLKQIAFHKEEKKWREAKHREEIQIQAASQIEEINKIKAIFLQNDETQRQDSQRAEMKWVKGQYETLTSFTLKGLFTIFLSIVQISYFG